MTRPRVTTVISAHAWEPELVGHARRTGAARIVARAYRPEDVLPEITDVVVVGVETAWLSEHVVGLWHARGIATVIVGQSLGALEDHLVETASEWPTEILAAVHRAWQQPRETVNTLSVAGASGSGVTEISCAMALLRPDTELVDRRPDEAALRLAVPLEGSPERIKVVGELRLGARSTVVIAAGDDLDLVVGERPILVVADTPGGYLRAASLAEAWRGPMPAVVTNQVTDEVRAAHLTRAAVGLEPDLLLPYDPAIRAAAIEGRPPPDWFTESLAPMIM